MNVINIKKPRYSGQKPRKLQVIDDRILRDTMNSIPIQNGAAARRGGGSTDMNMQEMMMKNQLTGHH